jgi:hypothetical protein
MNIDANVRTPYHTLPITLSVKSIDRKVWRDQYCVECGKPFIAINDKFVSIIDAAFPVQIARGREMVLEARCHNHYCKQYFHVYV